MSENELLDRAAVLLAELRDENDRLREENKRLHEAADSATRYLDEFLRLNGMSA